MVKRLYLAEWGVVKSIKIMYMNMTLNTLHLMLSTFLLMEKNVNEII